MFASLASDEGLPNPVPETPNLAVSHSRWAYKEGELFQSGSFTTPNVTSLCACHVLSRFSCIRLFATLFETVACQATLSMGFSGQRSGLPCPSPGDLPDM